jgi:hypothetical protein
MEQNEENTEPKRRRENMTETNKFHGSGHLP